MEQRYRKRLLNTQSWRVNTAAVWLLYSIVSIKIITHLVLDTLWQIGGNM